MMDTAGESYKHQTTGTGDGASSTSSPVVQQTLLLLQSEDPILKVQAAREIRCLTKTSQCYRRQFSVAVKPLVDMLHSTSLESNKAALLALLNLSVKEERNKITIIDAGALGSIIGFLQSDNTNLQDYATSSLLTLSASSVTKRIIDSSTVSPLLVNILKRGGSQAKVDAVMALYNLSTYPGNLTSILQTEPIPPIVALLKSCQKSSKCAEKCTALVESLMWYEDCRNALTSEEGGIIAVVEVLESGSVKGREHAVGALLKMCQSDCSKYREPILREGVIPGLLQLTVQGTAKSQAKARKILSLLRDTPCQGSVLQPDTLENIVTHLVSHIDIKEKAGKVQGLLAEMIQVSMDQSLRHLQLQHRELVCSTPADLSVINCVSKISST